MIEFAATTSMRQSLGLQCYPRWPSDFRIPLTGKQFHQGTELVLHLWEQLNACALSLSLAQLGSFFSATKHAKRRYMFAISGHLVRVVAILDRRAIVSSFRATGCSVTLYAGVAKSDP